jgi:hypothetical protein
VDHTCSRPIIVYRRDRGQWWVYCLTCGAFSFLATQWPGAQPPVKEAR